MCRDFVDATPPGVQDRISSVPPDVVHGVRVAVTDGDGVERGVEQELEWLVVFRWWLDADALALDDELFAQAGTEQSVIDQAGPAGEVERVLIRWGWERV